MAVHVGRYGRYGAVPLVWVDIRRSRGLECPKAGS